MNYGFVIDNRKCIGCHACTVACKSEHEIPLGVNRTHVKYVEKGVFPQTRRTFTVTRCNHCEDAPCVEICPTSALFTRRDGIVDFDSERCIACRSCMQACPYDALYIDPETRTAAKCNYCAHRVERGYEPACVIVCPVQAIVSGDLEDADSPIARLVAREEVSVRKPAKGARPNVYYVEGDRAALDPSAAAPADSYFASEQSGGVGHFARWVQERAAAAGEDLVSPFDPAPERGGVTLAGSISISQRAVDDVGRELAGQGRRVYDAPGKGILWGWQVAAYIWTKAVASGVVAVGVLWHLLGGAPPAATGFAALATALAFLGLTGLLLIADLDRPERFLYVLLRPNWRSWLVRGAYLISGLGLALTLWLVALWQGWEWLIRFARLAALPLAVGSAAYTAFLFAQARGRDYWQSALSPLRMLVQALLAGSAALLILLGGQPLEMGRVLLALVAANLLILLQEVFTAHPTEDATRAGRLVWRGPDSTLWWSGIGLGSLLPALLLLAGSSPVLLGLAAVLALGGVFLTEFVWVRAPQRIPLS